MMPRGHQNPAARPSASSVGHPNVNIPNRLAAQNLRTIADAADGSRTASGSTVRANPLTTKGETDADDADANLASYSVLEKNTLDGEADEHRRTQGDGLDLSGRRSAVLEFSTPSIGAWM
jgi:hypothetical protein